MEARLAEEVAGVCRDYCIETWVEALNRVGVLADSELRRVENIFLIEDIWEVPATLLHSVADLSLCIFLLLWCFHHCL